MPNPKPPTPDMRVLQGLAQARADEVFTAAETCAACQQLRRDDGDPEALCERHLDLALGVSGGWALGGPGRKL
jgi:hypothetical protein